MSGHWQRGRRDCEDCLQMEQPVCTMNCSGAELVTREPYPERIRCDCALEQVIAVTEEEGVCYRRGCPYGGNERADRELGRLMAQGAR